MKKIFLMATLLLAAMQASAADVDLVLAHATAKHFMQGDVSGTRFAGMPASEVKLLHAEANSSRPDQAVYYIFNSNKGFVIVAGDDRANQILAYGDRPLDMKRMPDNMKFWLSTYKTQIEYLQAHPGLVVDQPSLKHRLNTATVEPMLTAEWDQSAPYYNHCPKYNGSYCLTGCPATSLSMVFYYWKYPTDPTPEVEGYTNESYGFQVEPLPSITFDWDNMLDRYSGSYTPEQADAVAWLMRYVGQEEHMDYTPSGSGAMGADILRAVHFFGYDESAELVFKTRTDDNGIDTAVYYTDTEWAELLQNELAEGRPVVYCAYDYSDWWGWSGHAFNVDGYTASTDTYHVNWGWSGDGNGDFALNAFSSGGYNFNIEQQMIMGIQPPVKGPSIRVSPSKSDISAYVGQTATATFTVKGQELGSAITLTLNDDSGFFTIDASSVSVDEQQGGKVITVTYAPQESGNHTATIVLSNPAAEDKVVTINGVATLETYRPVMLPADSAFINLTSFRADWTDQTDAKNVASYTLEVSTRPATMLMLDADFSGLPSGSNVASNATDYLPEGWGFSGSSLWLDGGCLSLGYNSTITTCPIDLTGYDKVTVIVRGKNDNYYSSTAYLTVATSRESKVLGFAEEYADYAYVLDCDDSEIISFTMGSMYGDIVSIKVYGGELDDLKLLAAAETGDATYRLVTDITNRFYTVKDLEAAGTFYYRVKAFYIDGTESSWSKAMNVTLFDNGQTYELGDVNQDGVVNITDLTCLIDHLLDDSIVINYECSDMNADGEITIGDVTGLIDLLLRGH